MNRREFFKKCALAGVFTGIGRVLGNSSVFATEEKQGSYDVVAIKNGEPDAMFDKGIAALGGMKSFVKQGQTVVVKPNMSFASIPEKAATTNPILVKHIVAECYKAGAKKVYVIDHILTVLDNYLNGIAKAAEESGAEVYLGSEEKNYKEIMIPGAKKLKSAKVHELVINADVFINVPILKNHGGAKMTCALKGLMGVVWDMKYYHLNNLDQCIADFPLYRKPILNVVDAYRVMVNGGPRGHLYSRVVTPKMQFISKDIVAVDSISEKQAQQWGVVEGDIPYIKMAYEHHLGEMDISKMNIKKIVL